MTQLPQMMPAGLDPYAWLNYQAQLQALQNRQDSSVSRRQASGDREVMQLLMQLLEGGQQQQYQARQANEDRYLDILEGRTGTRNRILGDVNEFGDSLLDDVENSRRRREGQSTADLSRLGFLGSPSMKQAARTQNEKAYQEDLTRAKDSLLSQRIGADERLSNQISDFMERRTDSYPDTSQVTSIASTLGQLGVGNSLSGGRPVTSPATSRGSSAGAASYAPRGAARPSPGATVARPGIPPSQNYSSIFQDEYRPRTSFASAAMPVIRPPAPPVSTTPFIPAGPNLQNNAAFDPAAAMRKAIQMGADPLSSDAYNLVFNAKPGGYGGFGKPDSFKTTQLVQGWPQAGNAVHGQAIFAGQPGQYGADPYLGALLGSLLGGGGYGPRPTRDKGGIKPIVRPAPSPNKRQIISTPSYELPANTLTRPQYALA